MIVLMNTTDGHNGRLILQETSDIQKNLQNIF